MGTMASQITSLTIVYSTPYSGADQRKHQSFASLAFVLGIHRGPVNSPQMVSNAENVSIWWHHHVIQDTLPWSWTRFHTLTKMIQNLRNDTEWPTGVNYSMWSRVCINKYSASSSIDFGLHKLSFVVHESLPELLQLSWAVMIFVLLGAAISIMGLFWCIVSMKTDHYWGKTDHCWGGNW